MGIKHPFVSGIADDVDTTKVRPSNWNSDHTIDGDVNFGGFDITNCGNFTPSTFTPNYLNVKDFGAVGDGATDDTAAVQACFDEAWGTYASPHGSANHELNKAVYIPGGTYLITTTLMSKALESPHIFGDGKNASILDGVAAGTCWYINGCRHGRMEGFSLKCGSGALDFALSYDWTGGGDVPLTGTIFSSMQFEGFSGGIGCGIGISGFMGSENLFLHCTFANLSEGLKPYQQNAIDNTIIGGDAFNCSIAACSTFNGQVNTIIGWSTAGNGSDFLMDSNTGVVTLQGCRSESDNFATNLNGIVTVIACDHTGTGTFVGGGNAIVHCIGCTSSGEIDSTQLTWESVGTGLQNVPARAASWFSGIYNVVNVSGMKTVTTLSTNPTQTETYSNYPNLYFTNRALVSTAGHIIMAPYLGFEQSFFVTNAQTIEILCPNADVYHEGTVTQTGAGWGCR